MVAIAINSALPPFDPVTLDQPGLWWLDADYPISWAVVNATPLYSDLKLPAFFRRPIFSRP
jgi:hypothetical protein